MCVSWIPGASACLARVLCCLVGLHVLHLFIDFEAALQQWHCLLGAGRDGTSQPPWCTMCFVPRLLRGPAPFMDVTYAATYVGQGQGISYRT